MGSRDGMKHDGTVAHQRICSRPEPMAEMWRIPGGSPPRYALARLLGQPSLIASRAAASLYLARIVSTCC